MNRAKLAAVAQIAATISAYDMGQHSTCALGCSVRAGILTSDEMEFFNEADFCSSASAALQLEITEDQAENFFLNTESSHGSKCAAKIHLFLAETAMG